MFAAEKRAKFVPSTHTYYIDGKKVDTSVTRVVSSAFLPFNADAIIDENLASWRRGKYAHLSGTDKQVKNEIKTIWASSSVLGTAMHEWIELYLAGLDQPPTTLETEQFKRWWDPMKKSALRTELVVWWEKNGKVVCAGQIDALADDFVILDWKRVDSDLSEDSRVYEYGAYRIPNTKYHKYSLQLSMYWLMLEQTYGFIAPSCNIVAFFGDRPARPMVIVDYRKEARLLLDAL